MAKPKVLKSAAILTVKDAAKMTTAGRRCIALWLRRQASYLEKNGAIYRAKFRARYLSRWIAFNLLLLISIVASAYPVMAQQVGLEIGSYANASTLPRACGFFTVSVAPDAAAKTRSFSTFELCPPSLGTPSHRSRTGISRTLYRDARFELNLEVQGGVATGLGSTSGDFMEAGNITWSPPFAKGAAFVLHGGVSQVQGGNDYRVATGMLFKFGK